MEEIKLYDIIVLSEQEEDFTIQLFGLNEKKNSYCLLVQGFKPFFYVKVPSLFQISDKENLLAFIKSKIYKKYQEIEIEIKLIKRKQLYGFDGNQKYKFVCLTFENIKHFNCVKNLWFQYDNKETRLNRNGLQWNNHKLEIFESHIPPLLRFLHITDISPSGWIQVDKKKLIKTSIKSTHTHFEFEVSYKDIFPIQKEKSVPYKICSFDIEASSSHGDFPVPIKSYKKLANNIIDYLILFPQKYSDEKDLKLLLKNMILTAFGYSHVMGEYIEKVFTKKKHSLELIEKTIQKWYEIKVKDYKDSNKVKALLKIDSIYEKVYNEEDDDEQYGNNKTSISDDLSVLNILIDKTFKKDEKMKELCKSLDDLFPELEGDSITFIGSTFLHYGEKEPYLNHCVVLNDCDPIQDTEIECYSNEKDLLVGWTNIIQKENPDIIIGYNIFGFDYNFMFKRATENHCEEEFLKLSKNKNEICGKKNEDEEWCIDESSISIASGVHELHYIKMAGRLQIDLYNYFRREENLQSYKLDYVSGYFLGDWIIKYENTSKGTKLFTNNLTGLKVDSFIHLKDGEDYYNNGYKFKIQEINKEEKYFIINEKEDLSKKYKWGLAKDDVSPKEIFELSKGSSYDRSIIAKYCIQDCNLVQSLFTKIDVLTSFIEMSNICSVPMSYLVFRGQGIKLTSFISKKCREKNILMPVMNKGKKDEGYEGAIVLEPKCNMYLVDPIPVGDFASLYPSSMISENISHDSKVWSKEYNLNNDLIKTTGVEDKDGKFIYDNLTKYEYVDITYDTYKYVSKGLTTFEKVKNGYKVCRFAQFPEGKGILPSVLEELLKARNDTKKKMKGESDDFIKNVLDKRQLAYKITANSLYGQCGAKTSSFYEQDVAASTTATGRLLLNYAKSIVEECYVNKEFITSKQEKVYSNAEYIYGDTDSVFFHFHLENEQKQKIIGKKALEISIEIAQEACHLVSKFLKKPHDFEYEKTFMPFCLLSKKRYVGILYELDPNKGKRKEMGIVLKRRDNAPIVKDIYGGLIDILMKEQDILKAIEFLKECLTKLISQEYSNDKLIISKSLNSFYKNPQQIAHKVLADRITSRDPGNKPNPGDRIPFIYIIHKNKNALQGERIETPTYIQEHNLKIDYSFYITNQIMKPVLQLFSLVLEDIWKSQNKLIKINKFKKEVQLIKSKHEEKKWNDKIEQLKNKEVQLLLFDSFLRTTNNLKNGNQSIVEFFQKK
jgi:DNA polymerase elongation subunit (family B)